MFGDPLFLSVPHLLGTIRLCPMAEAADVLDGPFVGILRNLVIGDKGVELREGRPQGVLAFWICKG